MPNEGCKACFSNLASPVTDGEVCPGLVETESVSSGTETYFVQVCPREKLLGGMASFHGLSPEASVIVVHQDTAPTQEEYREIARSHDL